MVKLTIDHQQVEVQEGTTVMEAAAALGITIPAMCHLKGYSNHPSCMICLVKDRDRHNLLPSCAYPVAEGMHILTDTHEVREARKQALELLLSDHAGDCEAPCRISCPAFMDIPLMNRLIAAGDFDGALRVVREEIALPMVLGYICPAPCEKACKRKPIDQAVSICLLKRSSAIFASENTPIIPAVIAPNGQTVAIIGTGAAGLSAAFYLQQSGYACVLFDQHEKPGGALQYEIPSHRLPREVIETETGMIGKMGARYKLGVAVTGDMFRQEILPAFDAVILATGSIQTYPAEMFGLQPDNKGTFVHKKSFETSIAGVFGCGSMVREQKMAVQAVAQGKMAARQVIRYLDTKVHNWFSAMEEELALVSTLKSISTLGPLLEAEWPEYLRESSPGQRIEASGGHLAGFTADEAIREARRCMHCDCRKPVTCKLRSLGMEYHAHPKHFQEPDRNQVTRLLQHELVVYEPEKCIRCGLCVAITEEKGEPLGLTYVGRGFDVRISAPLNGTIRDALVHAASLCAEACPTGALSFKCGEERNDVNNKSL